MSAYAAYRPTSQTVTDKRRAFPEEGVVFRYGVVRPLSIGQAALAYPSTRCLLKGTRLGRLSR